MVLAGSFAGVFLRLYPSSRWPFVILLSIAAILLVVGDWHFLSDVIVGSFIGVSTGVLVGQLWQDHSDTGAG
jgi:membrane-associated phospholipid phosphatase